MTKILIGWLSLFFIMIGGLFSPAWAVKCADFKTQKEAQAYFIKKGDKRLDRDNDGSACDCLPGGNGTKCPKSKRK